MNTFLSEFLHHEVKEERFRIIDDMVHYVTLCVENQRAPYQKHEFTDIFIDSVRAAMFRYAERTHNISTAERESDSSKSIQLTLEAIKTCMQNTRIAEISKVHFSLNGLTEALCKELQAKEIMREDASNEFSVKQAYFNAKSNFYLVGTAIVFLAVIRKLLNPSPGNKFILRGSEEIRSELENRRRQFMLHILLFGNMLGDDYGREATKIAARETIYNPEAKIEFSIMQYLQPLCRVPEFYSTENDKIFREDIILHYQKLM